MDNQYFFKNCFLLLFFPQDFSFLWSSRNELQLFFGWMRLLSEGTLPQSFQKYEDGLFARRKRARESSITCSGSSFLRNSSMIYTYNHVNCGRQCQLHRRQKLYVFEQAIYLSFKYLKLILSTSLLIGTNFAKLQDCKNKILTVHENLN